MFKLTPIDKVMCRLFRDAESGDCDVYSIWQFCPNSRWRSIVNFFNEGPWCRAEWFPVIYWVVLAISMLGSFYSLFEFASLNWGGRRRVSVWRERKYYVLPYAVLRKCRLVGSVIMLNSWGLLWYGLINVVPKYMKPWLQINTFVLGFEFFTFVLEVMLGATKLSLHGLFTLLLPAFNFLLVRCVHNVFLNAIADGEEDRLRMWHNF